MTCIFCRWKEKFSPLFRSFTVVDGDSHRNAKGEINNAVVELMPQGHAVSAFNAKRSLFWVEISLSSSNALPSPCLMVSDWGPWAPRIFCGAFRWRFFECGRLRSDDFYDTAYWLRRFVVKGLKGFRWPESVNASNRDWAAVRIGLCSVRGSNAHTGWGYWCSWWWLKEIAGSGRHQRPAPSSEPHEERDRDGERGDS